MKFNTSSLYYFYDFLVDFLAVFLTDLLIDDVDLEAGRLSIIILRLCVAVDIVGFFL